MPPHSPNADVIPHGRPAKEQGGEVQQRETHGSGQQRPRPAQPRALLDRGDRRDRSVAPVFDPRDDPVRNAEDRDVEQQRRGPAQQRHQRDRCESRKRRPPFEVHDADHRSHDEEEQRHDHLRIATTDRKEGSRSTPATELHPDSEQERADGDRDADRRDEADDRLPPQHASGQGREEQQTRQPEHDHLRTESRTATVGQQDAECRGESEQRSIEDDPQCSTGQEQQRGADRRDLLDHDGEHRDDHERDRDNTELKGRGRRGSIHRDRRSGHRTLYRPAIVRSVPCRTSIGPSRTSLACAAEQCRTGKVGNVAAPANNDGVFR